MMFKKIISSILAVAMVAAMSTTVFAEESDVEKTEEIGEVFIQSQVFTPDGQIYLYSDNIVPYGPVYPDGTIKIDDVLGATSGMMSADHVSAMGSTFKTLTMTLIQGIPKIGAIVATGSTILDYLRPYNDEINRINYSKNITASTSYSYRNFNHIISAQRGGNSWHEVGTSFSQYFYKHISVYVYDNAVGDYTTVSKDFTHSKGFQPSYIAKAPNYMNYSKLTQYGKEAYATGRIFREAC